MQTVARLSIHPSQFPEAVRCDLLQSLRNREVNHKFHYDSFRQTQKWLALHAACSPSRTDPDCAATYERAFKAAAGRITRRSVHLIGLGCGSGQKEARLLQLLQQAGKKLSYTAVDVSTALVLVARKAALSVLPEVNFSALVCDLGAAEDLPWVLDQQAVPQTARILTFLGMIPNFEPRLILPRLATLVRKDDYLLVSANLVPGTDYNSGIQHVFPQYDNELTREWLLTFLLDLGFDRGDGKIRFVVETDPQARGLKRVSAHLHFARAREILVDEERFWFEAGDSIRLFFSYRYTPALLRAVLRDHGLRVLQQWITKSGEEAVFIVTRLK